MNPVVPEYVERVVEAMGVGTRLVWHLALHKASRLELEESK